MGTAGIPRVTASTAVMGTRFTVTAWGRVRSHGVTVGMGSNADCNTAVKCETSERSFSLAGRTLEERQTLVSIVTLLTACCSYMDCELYSF